MKRTRIVKSVVVYATLAFMLVCAQFPIYWMVNTSFKTQKEIYSPVPTFFPREFVWSSYHELIYERNFLIHVKNSFVVSLVVSVLSILVSALAAYAISRMPFRWSRWVTNGILYAYLLPRSVMFIPLYVLVSQLGLNNSLAGLMLIYPTFTIPYATWMLISYFRTIPAEVEEAALIDGCNRWNAMFRIVFPLSSPGIAATGLFAFTMCWCEYLYALVIISGNTSKTLTLSLADMVVADVYAWGPLMGGSVIASIPIILLYMFASKYMVSGLTLGGVK